MNGGTCKGEGASYTCDCLLGFAGWNCGRGESKKKTYKIRNLSRITPPGCVNKVFHAANLCANKVFHAMFPVLPCSHGKFVLLLSRCDLKCIMVLVYCTSVSERVACWKGDPQKCLQMGWQPCKIPLNPPKDRDGIERSKSKSKSKNGIFGLFKPQK